MTNAELVAALLEEYETLRRNNTSGNLPSLIYRAATELTHGSREGGDVRIEIGLKNGTVLALDCPDAKEPVRKLAVSRAQLPPEQPINMIFGDDIFVDGRDVSFIIPRTRRHAPKF